MNKVTRKISCISSYLRLYTTTIYTENPIVAVKQGKLRGSVKKLCDGSPYYSFKGIPYAEPPIGKLRFKAPVPPKPWKDIYDATAHGPICPEINKTVSYKEDENCLFINVYSKSLQSNSRLPVMVFIYGGAYMSGSGNSEVFGPEYLLQHDVVLVTFNYRSGVFGFLCLDTPDVPGNAAMKDQVAALRWVQDNISQFGGDPSNVTLFGESAGGCCVTYHMLSPMSNGLFHKAIAQSGVCIVYWAQGICGRDKARRLAKLFGKDTNESEELLDFLQTLSVEILASKTVLKASTDDERHRGFPIRFCPVVERKFVGAESFISEEPLEMILSDKIKKVPTILGYNSMEGIFFVNHQRKVVDFLNENPQYVVPREIAEKTSQEDMKSIGERIRRFYVGERNYTENDIQKISEREMDSNFSYSIHRFAHFYSRLNWPIYMYVFDCDTDLNLSKRLYNCQNFPGAGHEDDLYYFFRHVAAKDFYDKQEKLRDLVYRVTKTWTDFAKTGNPTPDDSLGIRWDPYTTRNKEYLHISHNCSMKRYAHRERIEFWDKVFDEVGLPSIGNT